MSTTELTHEFSCTVTEDDALVIKNYEVVFRFEDLTPNSQAVIGGLILELHGKHLQTLTDKSPWTAALKDQAVEIEVGFFQDSEFASWLFREAKTMIDVQSSSNQSLKEVRLWHNNMTHIVKPEAS